MQIVVMSKRVLFRIQESLRSPVGFGNVLLPKSFEAAMLVCRAATRLVNGLLRMGDAWPTCDFHVRFTYALYVLWFTERWNPDKH